MGNNCCCQEREKIDKIDLDNQPLKRTPDGDGINGYKFPRNEDDTKFKALHNNNGLNESLSVSFGESKLLESDLIPDKQETETTAEPQSNRKDRSFNAG